MAVHEETNGAAQPWHLELLLVFFIIPQRGVQCWGSHLERKGTGGWSFCFITPTFGEGVLGGGGILSFFFFFFRILLLHELFFCLFLNGRFGFGSQELDRLGSVPGLSTTLGERTSERIHENPPVSAERGGGYEERTSSRRTMVPAPVWDFRGLVRLGRVSDLGWHGRVWAWMVALTRLKLGWTGRARSWKHLRLDLGFAIFCFSPFHAIIAVVGRVCVCVCA